MTADLKPEKCQHCDRTVYQWPQVEALMLEAIEAFEHENGVKYVNHNVTDAAIAAVVARHKEGA